MTTKFDLAQQAANTAYAMTLESTHDEAQASDDYHSVMDAYNKRVVMAQHADGTVETHPGWRAKQEQRVEDVKPLCDETMRNYHDYTAKLTDDQIALMEAMTRETDRQEDYDSATEGHW